MATRKVLLFVGAAIVSASLVAAPGAMASHCAGKLSVLSNYEASAPNPVGVIAGADIDTNATACSVAPSVERDFRFLTPGASSVIVMYDANYPQVDSLPAIVNGLDYSYKPISLHRALWADPVSGVRSVYLSDNLSISSTASGSLTAGVLSPADGFVTVTYHTLP